LQFEVEDENEDEEDLRDTSNKVSQNSGS